MAEIEPSKFKIVQVYGGVKEALIEVEGASAADEIVFTDMQRVLGIQMVILQDADGVGVPYTVAGDDDEKIVIGTGPDDEPLKAIVKYRAY